MPPLLRVSLRNLFARPATRRYPAVRRPAYPGARGQLAIEESQCNHCGLCAKRCPADAIEVDREPPRWRVDPYRCILCGYCVEGCPKDCLSMRAEHAALPPLSADA
jgi:formate hydrogenlyase subunit 6/NADH:ubiquinone oxidoreductase subunit I